jgi:hypothetical protein
MNKALGYDRTLSAAPAAEGHTFQGLTVTQIRRMTQQELQELLDDIANASDQQLAVVAEVMDSYLALRHLRDKARRQA